MTENEFVDSLGSIGINLTEGQLKQLNIYYELLIEWNEKINLTAITEKEQVYLKHFYDSLTLNTIVNLDNNLSLIDVGTGAGFPGIVLKIVFPKLKITLIDSLNKRICFLKEVITKLNLEDIEAIHARSEEFALKNRECFDIATARAVAPLNILLEYIMPIVKVDGYFIPMKANISQEIEDSYNALNLLNSEIEEIKSFELPKENSKRNLIKIKKNKITKKSYPRKFVEIKKKPL